MTRILLSLIVGTLMVGCAQFPTRYERIEANALRPIGFVYEPGAEGAPGDTLRVKAYFAGKKVVSVSWRMSYNRIINEYQQDTVLDVFDLTPQSIEQRLPDSTEISFIIPDSLFYKTKAISATMLSLAKTSLPPTMQAMTQRELAALVTALATVDFNDPQSMAAFVQSWGGAIGVSTITAGSMDTIMKAAAALLPVFSVPCVLYANIVAQDGQTLTVKGDFVARYNRRFSTSPIGGLLAVNNNPLIHWIGVYKIKGSGVETFDPLDKSFEGKFSLSYIYNDLYPDSLCDTISIEDGYSYFVGADSGIVSFRPRAVDSLRGDTSWKAIGPDSVAIDTSIDQCFAGIDSTGKEKFEFETWNYDWEYQNMDLESVTRPQDSLFMLAGGRNASCVKMLPSIDHHLTHASIWVTVSDSHLEFNRPVGLAIRRADIYFKYAEK